MPLHTAKLTPPFPLNAAVQVRKDREPDEDDSAFALTRFVPMLQEVVEDAGECSGRGVSWGWGHGWG